MGFIVTMIHAPYIHAFYHQGIISSNDEKLPHWSNTQKAHQEDPGFVSWIEAGDINNNIKICECGQRWWKYWTQVVIMIRENAVSVMDTNKVNLYTKR